MTLNKDSEVHKKIQELVQSTCNECRYFWDKEIDEGADICRGKDEICERFENGNKK